MPGTAAAVARKWLDIRWETTTAEETNRLTDNRFTGCLWSHFDYVAVVAEQRATAVGGGEDLQFLFSSQWYEVFKTAVKTAEETLRET